MSRRRDLTQRAVDLVLAVALLGLSAPLWPLLWAAVRLDSPGPAIFRGTRMGRGGQEFGLLKFRSMVAEAPALGLAVTAGGDPRVTRVGRVLRMTKLDELPQLVNVLRGEMSLVGWRPEDPRYRAHYAGPLADILGFRPGITGPAAIAYRHEESILAAAADPELAYLREVLPAKLALDLAYCRRATLRSDLRILVETVAAVGRRRRSADDTSPWLGDQPDEV